MLFSKTTKLFKISILLITMCSPKFIQGQTLTTTDTSLIHSAKVIILSEYHLVDFFPRYKRKLIEDLYKKYGVTDLILEIGKSSAYLLNEYIATGDSSIIVNAKRENKDYFKEFSNYKLMSGKPVRIHGIDFERMDIVPALKRVLKKTGNTKNELFEYLATLPDTISQLDKYDMMKAERNAVIQKCRSIYQSDRNYYSAIYDDGYIVKDICENPTVEIEWDKRFDAMAHNLRLLYNNEGHKYLLIVGLFHVDCPSPIYKELEHEYELRGEDIINIAMVIKDCETSNMYYGQNKIKFGASKSILAEQGLLKSLFKNYSQPCLYQLVDIKTKFPNYKPSFKCDYILPINCGFEDSKCD